MADTKNIKASSTQAIPQRKGTQKAIVLKKDTVDDLGVYINLLTDFGFKRIFGTEANKDLLIAFLNAVLKIKGGIKDLHYVNTERKGRLKTDRTIVFDLHCITGKGERIIVEVQNQSHKNYKERGLWYACRSIQEQEKRGKKWKFELCPVYSVNIVNFLLDKTVKSTEKYTSYIQLIDKDTHKVFCDKMTFVYIELPYFNKMENELKNNVERWVYIFKNMHRLNDLPDNFSNQFFQKLFDEAKIANMSPEERDDYNESLKNYRHMNIVVDEYKEALAANRKTIAAMKKKEAAHANALAEQAKIIAEYQRRFGVLTSLN